MANYVLVHGAWHGPWCWDAVASSLRRAGHRVVATELHRGTLAADTAAVQRDVDALATRGSVVVCGHSYAGAVITGLRPDNLRRLIYLTAFMPSADESVQTMLVGRPASDVGSAMVMGDDGTSTIDPVIGPAVFYGDCDPADQQRAIASLRPQSMLCFTAEPGRAAWLDVPSTYVVCGQDRAITPELQRSMAARATDSVEWSTSHSPFMSKPEMVVSLLENYA